MEAVFRSVRLSYYCTLAYIFDFTNYYIVASLLIRAGKKVKIYQVSLPRYLCLFAQSLAQLQCEELSRRCFDLASSLQDHSPGLEGTPAQEAVDEVER